MKKNISFAVFATLLYCLPAEAGQPSLCQSGIATRQLCSNLDGIITGELQNISVLDKLNNKEIDSDKAINLILGAQKYIQSNYIDTISTILSGNLEQEDMRFARELNPRIVNVYRKCDLWVNQFQALKPETVSKVDYDNMTNYCKIEPQNLYDAYCKPMDERKCSEKGEKAGVSAFNEFKRKTGNNFCSKIQEIDALVQNKKIEIPVCDCDDAFNNAIDDYTDKQIQQLKEICKKENHAIETQVNKKENESKPVSLTPDPYYISDHKENLIRTENIAQGIQFNRVYWQNNIWIAGGSYNKVIGMAPTDNSIALAEFSIPQGARYFRSIFGLARQDERPTEYGRVEGRIYIDGNFQWSAVVDSSTLSTQTYAIAVPQNAKTLRLEVDSLGPHWADHATWANPYFSAF